MFLRRSAECVHSRHSVIIQTYLNTPDKNLTTILVTKAHALTYHFFSYLLLLESLCMTND